MSVCHLSVACSLHVLTTVCGGEQRVRLLVITVHQSLCEHM